MDNFLLELKNGQILRILPLTDSNLFLSYKFFYLDELKKFFILDLDTDIGIKSDISYAQRIFYLVEYNSELKIIQTGRSIRNKIDDYFSDDTGSSFYNKKHLLNVPVCLNVDIRKTSGFNNYDNSIVAQMVNNKSHNISNLFESGEYKNIISKFNNYIDRLKLVNRPDIIKYLELNNLLSGNYNYLLRSIKINDVRNRKVNTTKTKLWNQVIKMVDEISNNNENIEDIGYHKENGDEVHQFMVDGYLFEVKLIDKI